MLQLREIFDLYFSGELSYEDLKDKIRESNDPEDSSCILEILDQVERYFRLEQVSLV